MKTFQDNQGQTWTLQLTLGKVRRLRESLGLDLLNPTHYLQVLNSLTDRLAFVFLLIQPEAEKLKIDADAFEDRLQGDEIAFNASKAFLEETESFFQKLGQKPMAALARKGIETMDVGLARLSDQMESGDFDSLLSSLTGQTEKTSTSSSSN